VRIRESDVFASHLRMPADTGARVEEVRRVLEDGVGLVLLRGGPGSGKTTVLRGVEAVESQIRPVFFLPFLHVPEEEVLRFLLGWMGRPPDGGEAELRAVLQAGDRSPLLLVDEAQSISPEAAARLRTALESTESGVQIATAGMPSPELDASVAALGGHCTVLDLDPDETARQDGSPVGIPAHEALRGLDPDPDDHTPIEDEHHPPRHPGGGSQTPPEDGVPPSADPPASASQMPAAETPAPRMPPIPAAEAPAPREPALPEVGGDGSEAGLRQLRLRRPLVLLASLTGVVLLGFLAREWWAQPPVGSPQVPEPARASAPPEAGEPPSAAVAPIPAPVEININASPWARVRVDGRDLGDTPLGRVSLEPGPRRFELRFGDGRVASETIEVSPSLAFLSFRPGSPATLTPRRPEAR